MKRFNFSTTFFVIATISIVAVLMAGLMLLLIPPPGEVIRIAQWRAARAESFSVDMTARYLGKREYRDGDSFLQKERESGSVAMKGSVYRGVNGGSMSTQQVFSSTFGEGGNAIVLGGEYRRLGKVDFVRFSTLPDRVGRLSLEDYHNRWLRLSFSQIRENFAIPIVGNRGVEMNEADRLMLLALFKRVPFLRFEQKLKDEVISGTKMRHYQVIPEILFIKDYFIRAEHVRIDRELTNEERRSVDSFFANITALDGEIWIGKRDYYPYRLRLRFGYNDGKREGVFDLSVDFSKFNVQGKIFPPEGDVIEIEEIVDSLLPSITQHLPIASDGVMRKVGKKKKKGGLPIDVAEKKSADTDNDGLSDSLEAFFLTDPHNPDTDGDGMSDGEEVNKGRNPGGEGMLFDFGINASRSQ